MTFLIQGGYGFRIQKKGENRPKHDLENYKEKAHETDEKTPEEN